MNILKDVIKKRSSDWQKNLDSRKHFGKKGVSLAVSLGKAFKGKSVKFNPFGKEKIFLKRKGPSVSKIHFSKVTSVLTKKRNLLNNFQGQGTSVAKFWDKKVLPNMDVQNTVLTWKSESLPNKKSKKGNLFAKSWDKKGKFLSSNIQLFQGQDSAPKDSYAWVQNKVHPHHYSEILGYRNQQVIVNPNVTFQGVRRVLHFLKGVLHATRNQESAELIIVADSSMLLRNSQEKGQLSSTALIAYSLARLQEFSGIKISVKTTKETISSLATSTDNSIVSVMMISPAKSLLSTLADNLLKKDKKTSAGNAVGTLCAKKGIPLIGLCDISSPVNYYTYPIVCDTRNVKSIYFVFDLLTYGLNQMLVPNK